jgi:hypothetical protein
MAYTFDGSTEWLGDSSPPITAVGANGFTVLCKFKPRATAVQSGLWSITDISATNHYFNINVLAASDKVRTGTRGGGTQASSDSTGTVNIGVWNTVGGVWRTTADRSAYLNGTLETPETTSVTPANLDTFTLGGFRISGNTGYTDGEAAEFCIWDDSLTEEEMDAFDAGLSPFHIRPSALISYVPVIGDAGSSIDLITGNVLTETGTPVKAEHSRYGAPFNAIVINNAAAVGGATPHSPFGLPFSGPLRGSF